MTNLMVKNVNQICTVSGQDLKDDFCVGGLATHQFFFHACIPSKEAQIAVFLRTHSVPMVIFMAHHHHHSIQRV